MKKTRYEVEYDVRGIYHNIKYEFGLEDDFYGDYPDEIGDLENQMEQCEREEDYKILLDEVEAIFRSYVK